MEFGALPPEINSGFMYAGPGSGPMLTAAAGWNKLAAELHSTAASCQSLITRLTGEGWAGPASSMLAAAAAPHLTWMSATAAHAEKAAAQANAAAAAFEAAFAMTVPPPIIVENRARLMWLVSTNFLGQNTAGIAAAEARYSEMWAQDAAAMYGYAGDSAAASKVEPFTVPTETTNPAGQAGQAAAAAQSDGAATGSGAQSSLTQMISAMPDTLQGLASPAADASDGWLAGIVEALPFGDPGDTIANSMTNLMSSSFSPMGMAGLTQIVADMTVVTALRTAATASADMGGMGAGILTGGASPAVSGSGALGASGSGAVSAGLGRGTLVGALSVPQGWTSTSQVVAAPAAPPAQASLVSSWAPASPAAAQAGGMPGAPGMPMSGSSSSSRGLGLTTPRYGHKLTVMARPVLGG